MMEQLTSSWLLLIIPGLIWGASFLFMAEGLRSIGPSGVAFVRIAVGLPHLRCFPRRESRRGERAQRNLRELSRRHGWPGRIDESGRSRRPAARRLPHRERR